MSLQDCLDFVRMFVEGVVTNTCPLTASYWWLCLDVQVQDATEAGEVRQVVLQSGTKVGLCLVKPEDLKLHVLASGTTSVKNKVTEKFLTIRVRNHR